MHNMTIDIQIKFEIRLFDVEILKNIKNIPPIQKMYAVKAVIMALDHVKKVYQYQDKWIQFTVAHCF